MDSYEGMPQVDYQAEERLLVCSCSSISPSGQSWKDIKGQHKKERKQVKRTVFNENSSEEGTTTTSLIPIESEGQSYLELPNLGQTYSEDDSIQLFGGLLIRRDGGVRLIPGISHVCFGLNLGKISKVELIISQGVVDIEQTFMGKKQLPWQTNEANLIQEAKKALQILHANPDEFNQQVAKQVGECSYLLQILEGISPAPRFFRNTFQDEKDIEFQRFIKYSFDFIKQEPKSSMYSYNIGRINPQTEGMEILHSGYSQEYLALIGIDTDVLASLLLRKKKVELLLKTIDFNRLSASAMKWMQNIYPIYTYDQQEFNKYKNYTEWQISYLSELVSSEIVTFDGFRLMLNQRLKVLYTPLTYLLQKGIICDCSCGYFIQIFEFDVELSELEQLIAYRQRLFSQSNALSVQDYLRSELSLMFEDVEYSVRSSEFLEKFYSHSQTSLHNIQQQKEEQQKLDNLRCKYRVINS